MSEESLRKIRRYLCHGMSHLFVAIRSSIVRGRSRNTCTGQAELCLYEKESGTALLFLRKLSGPKHAFSSVVINRGKRAGE